MINLELLKRVMSDANGFNDREILIVAQSLEPEHIHILSRLLDYSCAEQFGKWALITYDEYMKLRYGLLRYIKVIEPVAFPHNDEFVGAKLVQLTQWGYHLVFVITRTIKLQEGT